MHVPIVKVNASAYQGMVANMESEFLAFYAYNPSNVSQISTTLPVSGQYGIALYNTECISTATFYGRANQISNCMVQNQGANLIKYNYSIGKFTIGNNATMKIVYTSSISIANRTVALNYSNPIIVYQTNPQDSFSGDIIHRLFAIVNASGKYYFLTKGDNNQALDIEFENYPANQTAVLGHVVGDIPLVGYFRLLLFGQIFAPRAATNSSRRPETYLNTFSGILLLRFLSSERTHFYRLA